MFRVSSDIIPFGSYEINNIKWLEKYKDISAIKLTNVLLGEKNRGDLKNIWGNYKYAIMERGYNYYKGVGGIYEKL